VDELEAENKHIAQHHSDELKTLEQTAEDKQKQLMETHRLTVQDLTDHHEQDLLAVKQHSEDTLAKLQQVVCTTFFLVISISLMHTISQKMEIVFGEIKLCFPLSLTVWMLFSRTLTINTLLAVFVLYTENGNGIKCRT